MYVPLQTVAVRKEKLERYRQKRLKRNYNREPNSTASARAQSRPRDENGHFVSTMPFDFNEFKRQLVQSQQECTYYKSRLADAEQELARMRKTAEEAMAAKEAMEKELLQQRQLTNQLTEENRLLWAANPSLSDSRMGELSELDILSAVDALNAQHAQ
jgi:bifunctional ADP-heptose synthase (sugar kinase/adenylyltransferase)